MIVSIGLMPIDEGNRPGQESRDQRIGCKHELLVQLYVGRPPFETALGSLPYPLLGVILKLVVDDVLLIITEHKQPFECLGYSAWDGLRGGLPASIVAPGGPRGHVGKGTSERRK
jgi:hypothetical protein